MTKTIEKTTRDMSDKTDLLLPEEVTRRPSSRLILTDDQKQRFLKKFTPEPNSGCWLWEAGCYRTGYGAFTLGHISHPAHRISFVLYGGKITHRLPHVLHSCNTRLCVNPSHLRAGTPKNNVDDMVACGRQASGDRQGLRLHPGTAVSGERHHNAKLDGGKIRSIRAMLASGFDQTEVAAQFNVHKGTVSNIARGKTWKHVA